MLIDSRLFCYKNDSIDKLIKYEDWRRGQSTSIRRSFCVGIGSSGLVYKTNKKKVYFFALKKTVGKYSFYTIETLINRGFRPSNREFPIDVPFEVEVNKTKYIGELNYNEKDGKFQLIDNFKSDSARFAKHYPQLDFSNAQ